MSLRKIAIILIAALLIGLFPHSWLSQRVSAAPPVTLALDAQADLMYDEEFGVLDNDTAGRFYAGRDLYGGVHYISRGAIRFNLDSSGPIPGTVIKYELQIHVITKENPAGNSFHLDVWGSSDNAMLDTDSTFPSWSNAENVRKEDSEIIGGQNLLFDVTSLVEDHTNASDRNVTFVITGNESLDDSRIIGGLKEESNVLYRPKLVITYTVNQPPTGSISINSAAAAANSTAVTLNLAGNDPDGDAMEMQVSNDNKTWSSWEPYNSTKSWTLSSGDGAKTVYYQLRDPSLAASPVYSDTITLDTAAPLVSGVAEGGLYTVNKTVTFNEGTATLDGNAFTSGTSVSAEAPDPHTLVVTDAAGNSTTVHFTIDKTAPTVTGVTDGASYNSDKTVTFSDGTATLNGTAFSSGTTITVEDGYTLVVTDAAGNSMTVGFTVDKTNPVVTGVVEGGVYNSDKTVTFNEGTAALDGNAFTSGTMVSAETPHTLIVTDGAGNSTTVHFTIDKTAPMVTGVTDGASYNADKTVTYSDGTATLNGTAFSSGTTITVEDDYTLVVADAAGNSTTVSFTIDKSNPVVTGVVEGGVYNSDKSITFNEGTATLDGNAFTSGTTVSAETPHTLIVTDGAGNSTTVHFTIDKTAPTVSGVTDGASYNSDKTVTYSEGTATLNGAAFTSGTTITAEDDYELIVIDAAGNSTTVSFTIDKTKPVVTGVVDGESYSTNTTVTFNEGTATLNGSPFTSGTTISTGGEYKLVVTDPATNEATIAFRIVYPNPGPVTDPNPGSDGSDDCVELIINGVVHDQIASCSTKTTDGNLVTTITIDENKLTKELQNTSNKPEIIIRVNNTADVVIVELNGSIIQTLNNKNASIQVQNENASYTISANQFNLNQVLKNLGPNIHLQDIKKISIEMTKLPDDKVDFIRNQAGKITLVAPAVNFSITAAYNDKTVEINKFNSFAQRTITILDDMDPKKITTGVVVAENGKVTAVPTRIIQKDGKYYAVIRSLTNGIYTVIYNEKSFIDITNHWARSSIEDMAARLILQGVNEKQFQPNKEVTRAEFTTIVVRALGLHANDQPAQFKDVHEKDWFYDAVSIAAAYGLVEGNTDNTFKPNQKLTREEAMIIIYKAMKLAGMNLEISEQEISGKLSVFKDAGQFKPASRLAAALTVKFGIIQGYNGYAMPGKTITRAETAAIIQLFLQQAKLI
ncbi:S-layer homology domain-containing protein [Paenibacillus solisilvae]|uniref:S-layer homology domain-containing protein n=1 Tax=Paenibacillus solisilvae TaxID=2486751 RepID=A0ABW0VYI6_9BACL